MYTTFVQHTIFYIEIECEWSGCCNDGKLFELKSRCAPPRNGSNEKAIEEDLFDVGAAEGEPNKIFFVPLCFSSYSSFFVAIFNKFVLLEVGKIYIRQSGIV